MRFWKYLKLMLTPCALVILIGVSVKLVATHYDTKVQQEFAESIDEYTIYVSGKKVDSEEFLRDYNLSSFWIEIDGNKALLTSSVPYKLD